MKPFLKHLDYDKIFTDDMVDTMSEIFSEYQKVRSDNPNILNINDKSKYALRYKNSCLVSKTKQGNFCITGCLTIMTVRVIVREDDMLGSLRVIGEENIIDATEFLHTKLGVNIFREFINILCKTKKNNSYSDLIQNNVDITKELNLLLVNNAEGIKLIVDTDIVSRTASLN